MCGIGGIISVREPVTPEVAAQLSRLLLHRGPDDEGFASGSTHGVVVARTPRKAPVVLVHRRLSIIDLSETGWQPMRSADGRFTLLFNGEIYNYVELRAELHANGVEFRGTCDSEVLLAAWARWGADCLKRLIGMFAFAVHDAVDGTLTLVRDAFGIKPLFYAQSPDRFAFASELPALVAVDGQSRHADAGAVRDYLQLGLTDHAEATMFRGIRTLPPAHFMVIGPDAASSGPQRWWQAPRERQQVPLAQAAEQLRELFLDSIRLHLRSDVPLGTALSGGLDSSAIVSAMRAVGGSELDIRAFGFVPDDPSISEERWMWLAAEKAGAKLSVTTAGAHDLIHDLDDLVRTQGEPFGSTSIYAQRKVFQLARDEGIKVMLDGQGADELFAGYRAMVASRAASLLRSGRMLGAAKLAQRAGALPGPITATWHMSRAGSTLAPRTVVKATRRLLRHDLTPTWLNNSWFIDRGVDIAPVLNKARSLTDDIYEQVTTTSLPALLRFEDRNSMTWSIESRVPFLTIPIVDFAMRLPEALLIDNYGIGKRILRDAVRPFVPREIVERRDKVAFATPEQEWLRQLPDWVGTTMRGASTDGPLNVRMVAREYDDVMAGQRRFDWRLWRCMNLIRWSELFDIDWRG